MYHHTWPRTDQKQVHFHMNQYLYYYIQHSKMCAYNYYEIFYYKQFIKESYNFLSEVPIHFDLWKPRHFAFYMIFEMDDRRTSIHTRI